MHDLSENTKRFLDACTMILAGFMALTAEQVAFYVTIGAGVMSIACGAIRVHEWWSRRRAANPPAA